MPERADGKTVHVRKTTRAEPRQRAIYDARGISDPPGRTEKTVVEHPQADRVKGLCPGGVQPPMSKRWARSMKWVASAWSSISLARA